MNKFDNLSISIKMTIIEGGDQDNGTLGKGVVSLLQGIVDTGSLNQAAKKLGMAYSKAWRIIKETESGFGFFIIDRDGARGSTLTEEGMKLLNLYNMLEKETSDYANRRFREEISNLHS